MLGLLMAIAFGLITLERGAIVGLLCMAGLNIAAALYVRKLPIIHDPNKPVGPRDDVTTSKDVMNRP